jgi:hypothetical protein
VKYVGLVGCTKEKLDHRAPARDLYRASWQFRQSVAHFVWVDEWWVLSAKHGLVHPGTELDPYDVTLPELSADQRRAWGKRMHTQLLDVYDHERVEFYALASAPYLHYLRSAIKFRDWALHNPLAGMSQGARRSWLAGLTTSFCATPHYGFLNLQSVVAFWRAVAGRRADACDRCRGRLCTPDKSGFMHVCTSCHEGRSMLADLGLTRPPDLDTMSWERAGGAAECSVCGLPYSRHPSPRIAAGGAMHKLCAGAWTRRDGSAVDWVKL